MKKTFSDLPRYFNWTPIFFFSMLKLRFYFDSFTRKLGKRILWCTGVLISLQGCKDKGIIFIEKKFE